MPRHSHRKSVHTRVQLLASLALLAGVWFPASAPAADAPAKPAAPAAGAKAEKPTVSKAMQKPLSAIQELLKGQKYPEAIAKLEEARAMPGRAPYDDFIISEFSYQAYLGTKDYANATKAISETLDSGFLEPADSSRLTKGLAQLYYVQLKNYDKAIEIGNRAIQGGFADEDVYTLVGQAYYVKGDYPGSLRFWSGYIGDLEKAGRVPKEQSLQILMSSCLKVDDEACTSRALERLVTYYPKPDYWQNLLYTLLRSPGSDTKWLLDLYRLMSDVDILKRADDYAEMAQLAIEAGSPGEAQKIIEKGFAKNVFTDARDKDKNLRLLESAKKQAAIDKAQLASLEKTTSAAKAGDPDVKLGLAYLSYDQFDKAAAAIQRGIAKGGVKNPAQAQILLGIAQLKLKNKDEAIKAFTAAKSDPKLGRLANLWMLHAQQS